MKAWLKKINRWNFDRKMSFFLTIAVVGTSLLILLVSTVSLTSSMTQKTEDMMKDQLATLASNYDEVLTNYKTLSYALIMDSSVQDYLHYTDKSDPGYDKAAEGAGNAMRNAINMHESLNFVAIYNYQINDYLYKGRENLSASAFEQSMGMDREECMQASDHGTMGLNFSNNYYKGEKYTMNVYHPMYSTNHMIQELGVLTLSLNDNLLEQLFRKVDNPISSEIFLINTEGTIVSISDRSRMKTKISYMDKISEESGSFRSGAKYVEYQKVGKWNYYLVYTISLFELYRSTMVIVAVMVIVILIMTMISIVVTRKVIARSYQPLDRVVSQMDKVAAGSLDVRVDEEDAGEDFAKLSVGFNTMMDEILVLMEQVKLEQHQMEQIRFNALQAQIQPHFLYNTLECIHWQAMADGNQEISTLVKALAKYYRICLSRGKDIIDLEQELEHVKAYLTIQNMRYDNIIEYTISVDEQYMGVKIPKMTLQPLVENSIYHGIKVREGQKGTVHISVENGGDTVDIVVEDSGSGMSLEQIEEMNASISVYDDSFGYGVRNVNKRIEIMFGKEYGLRYFRNEQGGVTVKIHLPLKAEIIYEEVL